MLKVKSVQIRYSKELRLEDDSNTQDSSCTRILKFVNNTAVKTPLGPGMGPGPTVVVEGNLVQQVKELNNTYVPKGGRKKTLANQGKKKAKKVKAVEVPEVPEVNETSENEDEVFKATNEAAKINETFFYLQSEMRNISP